MLDRIKKYLNFITGSRKECLSLLSAKELDLVSRIRQRKLTYLTDRKIVSLIKTCQSIEENNLSGIFLEAGCALGGSAILIASLKSSKRPFFIYDAFETIPRPTKDDTQDAHDRYKTIAEGKSKGIGHEKYYGYEKNLYEIVQNNLTSFQINCEEKSVLLIKGLIQDTMKFDQPIAFSHVDVDWYEPVMTCLDRIFPNLVVGGCIILDDYHDWGGCKKATDEYLRGVTGQFSLDDSAGSMKITKI